MLLVVGQSVESPHAIGLFAGQAAIHFVLDGMLAVPTVMQHDWVPVPSPPVHSTADAPVGHMAADAAHVP